MPKPWCAFFGLEAGASARNNPKPSFGFWRTLILGAAIAWGGGGARAETAEPATLPQVALDLEGPGPHRVGDRIPYRLTGGSVPEGAAPVAPAPTDPKKPLAAGYLIRPGQIFVPLRAGTITVPSLDVLSSQGDRVATTLPFEVKVESNLDPNDPKAKEPAPAYGPVRIALPKWAVVAAVSLAALLLGIALFLIVRWILRKVSEARARARPPKTIDELALEALAEIESKRYVEQGKFKPFYFGVSDTLKKYLGVRFDFDAEESTTSEMIEALRRIAPVPGLTDATADRIHSLFERMDLIKFTDTLPDDGEPARHLAEARSLVSQTRKVPDLLPPGAAGTGARR